MNIGNFFNDFINYLKSNNKIADEDKKLSDSRLISKYSSEMDEYAKESMSESEFNSSIFAKGDFNGFNVSSLSSLTYDNDKNSFVNKKSGDDNELDELDLLAEYLNKLTEEDPEFFGTLDQDGDKKLSKDEFGAFTDSMAKYDADKDSKLDFGELDKVSVDISNSDFKIPDVDSPSETPSAPPAGGGGGGGGGGGTNPTTSTDPSKATTSGLQSFPTGQDYTKLSDSDLEATQSTYQSALDSQLSTVNENSTAVDTAQSKLTEVEEAQNKAVETAKEAFDTAEGDLEKLQLSKQEDIEAAVDNISEKEDAFNQAQDTLTECTNKVADAGQAYSDATVQVGEAETSLSTAESNLASAPKEIQTRTDPKTGKPIMEPNPAIPGLEQAVADAEAALEAAKEAQAQAEENVSEATDALSEANDALTEATTAKDEAVQAYCDIVNSLNESEQTQLKAMSEAILGLNTAENDKGQAIAAERNNVLIATQQVIVDTDTYQQNVAEMAKLNSEINSRKSEGKWTGEETFSEEEKTDLQNADDFEKAIAEAGSLEEVVDLYKEFYGDEATAMTELNNYLGDLYTPKDDAAAPNPGDVVGAEVVKDGDGYKVVVTKQGENNTTSKEDMPVGSETENYLASAGKAAGIDITADNRYRDAVQTQIMVDRSTENAEKALAAHEKPVAINGDSLEYGGLSLKLSPDSAGSADLQQALDEGKTGTFELTDALGNKVSVQLGENGSFNVTTHGGSEEHPTEVSYGKTANEDGTITYNISSVANIRKEEDGSFVNQETNSYSMTTASGADTVYTDKNGNTGIDSTPYSSLDEAKQQKIGDKTAPATADTADTDAATEEALEENLEEAFYFYK